jgi:hypothetical protein
MTKTSMTMMEEQFNHFYIYIFNLSKCHLNDYIYSWNRLDSPIKEDWLTDWLTDSLIHWLADWLTHSLTHWLLTPRRWVLIERPIVAKPLKKFLTFYGTQKFITMFTRAHCWSLSWIIAFCCHQHTLDMDTRMHLTESSQIKMLNKWPLGRPRTRWGHHFR